MAARTLTQIQTRVSERAKAALLALFLGAFFVWGAALPTAQCCMTPRTTRAIPTAFPATDLKSS